jgi:hypothetical protein
MSWSTTTTVAFSFTSWMMRTSWSASAPVMPAAGSSEQQQPGPLRQHEADLDQLTLAVGKLADEAARDPLQRDLLHHLLDGSLCRRPVRMDPARRQEQVLLDVQAVHHRRYLGLDADPEVARSRRRASRDVLPAMKTRPWLGSSRICPVRHLKKVLLAGTIRADQAAQLAVAQREIDVVVPPARRRTHDRSRCRGRFAHRGHPSRRRIGRPADGKRDSDAAGHRACKHRAATHCLTVRSADCAAAACCSPAGG